MTESAHLVVERNSERDIKIRDLYVRIDDEPERTLLFGESLDQPMSPGEHRIQVSNRIYKKTVTFEVKEGETVRFEGVNLAKKGFLSVLAAIAGTVMYRPELSRIA